ncbi:MAG: hypothetical protein RLZZ618_685 [Pseudomonadota bacterium]|jgi:AcrR family transcriptional regulator
MPSRLNEVDENVVMEAEKVAAVAERSKRDQTMDALVSTAFDIAKRQGLLAVTLTSVARQMGVSKAGVALRAGSVSELQHLVLDEYERLFQVGVFRPAMAQPRGAPRMDTLIDLWVEQGAEINTLAGSLYAVAAFDVAEAQQPLRERLLRGFRIWQGILERSVGQAVDEEHLRKDTDVEQLVFDILGLMMSFLYAQRLTPERDALARVRASYVRLMLPYRVMQALKEAKTGPASSPVSSSS